MITSVELARLLTENAGRIVEHWQESDGAWLVDVAMFGLAPMRVNVVGDQVVISDGGAAMELLESRLGRKLTPADKRLLLRTCLPPGVELQGHELTFRGHTSDVMVGLILVAATSDKVATGLELLRRIMARNLRKAKAVAKPRARRGR